MGGIGGSVISISLNGRSFAVPADTDITLKLGGFENETQANGDGSTRKVKTRVPWSATGCKVATISSQADQEYIQELSDGDLPVDAVFELTDGSLYTGKGDVNGEVGQTTQNAVTGFDMAGEGKLAQQ